MKIFKLVVMVLSAFGFNMSKGADHENDSNLNKQLKKFGIYSKTESEVTSPCRGG